VAVLPSNRGMASFTRFWENRSFQGRIIPLLKLQWNWWFWRWRARYCFRRYAENRGYFRSACI